MNSKQKTIFIIEALIKSEEAVEPEMLLEKLEACLELQRPEVLLTEKSKVIYEKLVEEARRRGRII